MQMSEQEKRSIIEAQLSEGFRDVNAPISDNELKSILNKRSQGKGFSDDLFNQLREQLAKSDAELTIRNFTDIWLLAENRLQNSVEQLESEVQIMANEKEELVEQKKNLGEERLNPYGLMENAQLVVTLHSVENITRADGIRSNANFILSCEGQSAETGNSLEPSYFNVNKTFKFNIKTGSDPLIVNLIPTSSNDPKDGGLIQIPLKTLVHQDRITQSLEFATDRNQLMETRANFDIQYVFSNVKLVNKSIQAMNEAIQRTRLNKENAESYIEELYNPFPQFKRTLKPKERQVSASPFSPTVNLVNEKQFSKMPESTHSIYAKLLLYANYLYFFVAFFLSFHRCVFLDLLVSLLFFSALLFDNPKLIKGFVNKVIGGIVLAIIIDIAWLILYTTAWWNTTYQDSYSLLYVRRIMVVMSYVIMLVRVFVLVVLALNYNDYSSGEDEFTAESERAMASQPVFSQY